MNLKHVDGLLQVSMQITYQGRKQLIDKLVIDTGAVHTIILFKKRLSPYPHY